MSTANKRARPQLAQGTQATDTVEWREEWVPLGQIIRHDPLQVRHKLDMGAVRRYRDMTQAGSTPPPIKVGRMADGRLFLVDGWHRTEAGALVCSPSLDDSGDEVLALVADMTEAQVRWESAKANLGHGVPLKPGEMRMVFRAYVKAGKHKGPGGQLQSYRDIGAAIGKPHTTIRNWMKEDFPRIAERMGDQGPEYGNKDAEQPPTVILSLAEEQCQSAEAMASSIRSSLPAMSPQQRYKVLQAWRDVLRAAEQLGAEAPAPDPF